MKTKAQKAAEKKQREKEKKAAQAAKKKPKDEPKPDQDDNQEGKYCINFTATIITTKMTIIIWAVAKSMHSESRVGMSNEKYTWIRGESVHLKFLNLSKLSL